MTTERQELWRESPFIEQVWQMENDEGGQFTSVANTHSEIVIARLDGDITVTIRGPETEATAFDNPGYDEVMGIVFKLGTFIPTMPPKHLANLQDANLPVTDQKVFWFADEKWEIPTWGNVDGFVERLVREGLLKRDMLVNAALQGEEVNLSQRALQYRFVQATGLTQKAIQQIERAQRATALLQSGYSILDAVYDTGYYDQSHLTNALKRFVGKTPGQILEDE